MAHSRPAAKATPLPLRSGPRTRTERNSAAGAIEWMIPAQAVAWPNTSVGSSSTTWGSSSTMSTRTLPTSLPPTAGWLPSTPESMIAPLADERLAPRREVEAHSGSLARPRGSAAAASAPRCLLGVPGEDGEQLDDELELIRIRATNAGHEVCELPQPALVLAVETGRGPRDDLLDLDRGLPREQRRGGGREQRRDIPLDAAGGDGDGRLAGEDSCELDVPKAERGRVALVEDLEDADRAVVVD